MYSSLRVNHRRRINKEEKAKVVASVWGKDFINFIATLPLLPRMILNNWMNCTRMMARSMDTCTQCTQ